VAAELLAVRALGRPDLALPGRGRTCAAALIAPGRIVVARLGRVEAREEPVEVLRCPGTRRSRSRPRSCSGARTRGTRGRARGCNAPRRPGRRCPCPLAGARK